MSLETRKRGEDNPTLSSTTRISFIDLVVFSLRAYATGEGNVTAGEEGADKEDSRECNPASGGVFTRDGVGDWDVRSRYCLNVCLMRLGDLSPKRVLMKKSNAAPPRLLVETLIFPP